MKFSSCVSRVWRSSRHLNLTRTPAIFPYRLYAHSNSSEIDPYEELILTNTVISNDHLTPELKLRLITPACPLWNCKSTESKFPDDPFWAIYWPGGQALGRYILNNRKMFYQKNVLDVGSGSGACAIAAAKCGAKCTLANDIDPVSLSAIKINAQLNEVQVFTSKDNLIGKDIDALTFVNNGAILTPTWDVILIGDMFYDLDFSEKLFIWLCKQVKKGKTVLVGDPGRHVLKDLALLKEAGMMRKIVEYGIEGMGHNGFPKTAVYKIEADTNSSCALDNH